MRPHAVVIHRKLQGNAGGNQSDELRERSFRVCDTDSHERGTAQALSQDSGWIGYLVGLSIMILEIVISGMPTVT